MKLIGFERKTFNFENGTVTGYNLFLSESRKGVEGLSAERVFCSDNKLNGYSPKLNDELIILYNRFGKVQEVRISK